MEPISRVNGIVLLIGIALTGAALALAEELLCVNVLEAANNDSGRRQLNKRQN